MKRTWRDFDPARSQVRYDLDAGRNPQARRLIRKEVLAAIKRLKRQASRIANSYSANAKSASNAPKVLGTRNTKRIPIPPFQRPETRFKLAVYQLAVDIHRNGIVREVEATVRNRDEPFRHKPRDPTAVDWAIKLVDRAPRGEQLALKFKNSEPLLDPTLAGHLAIELNFALRHGIKPECAAMFIDQVGGHEIISGMQSAGGYDLKGENWISDLCDRSLLRSAECEPENPDIWDEELEPPELPAISVHEQVKSLGSSTPKADDQDDDEDWG